MLIKNTKYLKNAFCYIWNIIEYNTYMEYNHRIK